MFRSVAECHETLIEVMHVMVTTVELIILQKLTLKYLVLFSPYSISRSQNRYRKRVVHCRTCYNFGHTRLQIKIELEAADLNSTRPTRTRPLHHPIHSSIAQTRPGGLCHVSSSSLPRLLKEGLLTCQPRGSGGCTLVASLPPHLQRHHHDEAHGGPVCG